MAWRVDRWNCRLVGGRDQSSGRSHGMPEMNKPRGDCPAGSNVMQSGKHSGRHHLPLDFGHSSRDNRRCKCGVASAHPPVERRGFFRSGVVGSSSACCSGICRSPGTWVSARQIGQRIKSPENLAATRNGRKQVEQSNVTASGIKVGLRVQERVVVEDGGRLSGARPSGTVSIPA